MTKRFPNASQVPFRGLAFALALAFLLLALLPACVDPNAESDLPWNAAQPWETAPAGFSNLGSRM